MKQDKEFKNKTVLITGSSRGVGKSVSIGFAQAGANVVLCSKNNGVLLKEVQNEIVDLGGHVLSRLADVTKIDEVEDLVDAAVKRFGNVDVLINNAGNFINSVVRKMDEEVWSSVIDVNLNGVFNCTKIILNKTKASRIVNISSVQGQTGVIGAANYAAAKAGVVGFTKSVAKEVSRKGITANVIALGFFNTGMLLRLPETMQEAILSQIPMNRFGDPEEAANLAMFLASDKAAYITGQSINLNGGYYM